MDINNINRDRDTSGLGPIEYDQSKVPSLIRKHADNVRTKTYGQEVREAQARNAEYAGLVANSAVDVSNKTKGRQDDIENQFVSLQQEMTDKDVISAPEIIAARNGEGDLKSRLDRDKQEASAKITLNVGISIEDFPRLSPEDDDMPRFQRAINSLSPENPRLIVTNKQAYTFKFKQGSTIQNPTRVEVKQDGVEIIGIGKPVIKMIGLTKGYLDSIDDYASSGRDIFTAFSIMGAKDVSVDNIEFIGEYNPETDGYFRYASPRAIAVGVKGGTNVQISNVKGSNILGNVVNAVNSNITYDVGYANSEHVKIINSQAIDCLENGFNFMGGTKYGFVSGLFGEGNANGLETGCENINVINCIFDGNRGSAVGISGKGAVLTGVIGKDSTGETGKDNGYGIAITGGSDIYISGGTFTGNKGNGLIIYPGTENISIDGADFSDSGEQSTYKTNVYAAGTEAKPIKNLKIKNSSFVNDLAYNGIFNWTEKLEIINSNGFTNANVSMVVNDKSKDSKVVNNGFNKVVSGSDISGEYRNNGNKRITEMSSVPTNGTWRPGDVVINSYTGIGVWVEAVCVMGGTFGTSQEPIFSISRQNGHKNNVSTSPDFVGQTAQTLGASPKFYVATGTTSPSDWQLISQ